MVLEFSGRLREELTKLREKSIRQLPVRDRAGSGTSGTRRILPDRIGSLRDTSDADDIDAFEWTGQLETLG
jgi:hypothetical protein